MGEAVEAGLGLASPNNFSRLWDMGLFLVVWYLALGSCKQETVAQSLRGDRRGGWIVGSGLVGLNLKNPLLGKLLLISRSRLARGGAVPPGLARPQRLIISIQKIKDMVNILPMPFHTKIRIILL